MSRRWCAGCFFTAGAPTSCDRRRRRQQNGGNQRRQRTENTRFPTNFNVTQSELYADIHILACEFFSTQ